MTQRKILYGVWNGVKYDNTDGGDAAPDGLNLAALTNFNPGNPIDAIVGAQGFLVFDAKLPLAGILLRYYRRAREASCGRCTPCRVASILMETALQDTINGYGRLVDWDHILESAEQMKRTSLCGIGLTTPAAMIGAIKFFLRRLMSDPRDISGDIYSTVTAKCIEACPSHVNIPRYISYVKDGRADLAMGVLLEKYPLVATCGRVCVRPCEAACRRKMVDAPVAIRDIKRFVSDNAGASVAELFHGIRPVTDATKAKVAVVGAGPAGLNCAYHLLMKGYPVDIYDKDEKAGGMALRGIPPYRLPKGVLQSETDAVRHMGGTFRYGQRLGQDFTISKLFDEGYGAVFLGIGCAEGAYLGLPDEDRTLQGYRNGIDFLLECEKGVAAGEPPVFDGDIVVVGCGNVAMDCCRTAQRTARGKVHIVYRRTIKEASADHEEIEAAEAEGVEFHFLTNPVAILSEAGEVTGVKVTKMELTEPDARGRRGVRAVPGSEFVIPCKTLIAAIGQKLERGALAEADGVQLNRWGNISVTEALATSRPGVFAGGDCATGPTTLIGGLSLGQLAADSIDEYLSRGSVGFVPRNRMAKLLSDCKLLEDGGLEYPQVPAERAPCPHLPLKDREKNFKEVDITYSEEEAIAESERCMACYRLIAVVTPRPIPGNEQEKKPIEFDTPIDYSNLGVN